MQNGYKNVFELTIKHLLVLLPRKKEIGDSLELYDCLYLTSLLSLLSHYIVKCYYQTKINAKLNVCIVINSLLTNLL